MIIIGQLTFDFDPAVVPFQYEVQGACVQGWPNGFKVVDVVAHECASPPEFCFLVEVKDFRVITQPPKRSNLSGLAETMALKVRNTLAALPIVERDSNDASTRQHASVVGTARRRRVVLHLEPHPVMGQHAALFPDNFVLNVLLRLRQLLEDIDPNLLVLDIARTRREAVPWTVR